MVRHYAFYRQADGVYLREAVGDVPDPDLPTDLHGPARLAALDAWATAVSAPEPGEIGLDVTQFGYPLGDFCWSRFDVAERRLEFDQEHRFIQIDRATREITGNHASPRPVRSTADALVVDITGTPLAAFWGQIFGRVEQRRGQWVIAPRAHLSATVQRQLQEQDCALVVAELVKEPMYATR